MNPKQSVIKIPSVHANDDDNSLLNENTEHQDNDELKTSPIVVKKNSSNQLPPRSPTSPADNEKSDGQYKYPSRASTPDDIDIQRRFHELCYNIKEGLMKEDQFNTNFNMSIQELYDISKFLNIPESEWINFIPIQLSHGSPAAMSWVLSLVKLLRIKDSEIKKLKERIDYMEGNFENLRDHVSSIEALMNGNVKRDANTVKKIQKEISKIPKRKSTNASTNTNRKFTADIGTTTKGNNNKLPTKKTQETKMRATNENSNTKKSITEIAKKKNVEKLDEKAIAEPQSFRSAKDFLQTVSSGRIKTNEEARRPSFNGNTNANTNPFLNRNRWLQEQLLRKDKKVDTSMDAQLNAHVSFAANWNVDYSKTLRKY